MVKGAEKHGLGNLRFMGLGFQGFQGFLPRAVEGLLGGFMKSGAWVVGLAGGEHAAVILWLPSPSGSRMQFPSQAALVVSCHRPPAPNDANWPSNVHAKTRHCSKRSLKQHC